jgi:hypothetical protein
MTSKEPLGTAWKLIHRSLFSMYILYIREEARRVYSTVYDVFAIMSNVLMSNVDALSLSWSSFEALRPET